MKSLKKLLAVLMTVALVAGMLVVPVFAASDYEDEAKTLYDLGLFKGKSETAYEPALEDRLLREEGVALLLRIFNLEDEALAMDQAEAENLLKQKFSDAGEIAAWAVKYIAYAVKNNIVAGRPDGKFAPKDNLLGREYAKMVLALLGYVQGEDFEYKFSIAEFAEKTGFSKSEASRMDEAFLLRGDVVGMSYAALSAEYKTGPNAGKKVIDVIVEGDEEKKAVAIAAGLIEEAVIVSLETLYDIEINVGETLNLPNQVKAFYSDGTTAMLDVAWPTVDNTKAMPKTEIEGVVSDTDLKAKINVTIKEAQLRVVSVSTDNLTQVKVEYNLDVTTNAEVAKKDNYTLSTGKIDTVSASGKVAVLNLTKDKDKDSVPKNQTNAKLTISDKILGSKQEFEFKYFDATLPQVVGFEATGPKEFTAYFDEPIKDKGTVTVKSGTSTLSVNVSGIGERTDAVKIPLYSTLADGKDYDITIQGFKDYAGFENIVKSLTYTYVKDTSAPVATIKSAKQECVEVEFNKPVSGIIREMFSHTFTAWIATKVTSDADGNNLVDSDDSYSKVYAWFYTGKDDVDRPIPEGETTFRILGKATVTDTSTSYEIKDLWGNKFETADFTISVAADKTAPEVKEIKVTAEDAIEIEFSKKVSFGKDNIEVLDDEGKAISGLSLSFDPTSAATKFTVTFNKKLAGKTIIVNIKNVYDATLNSNKLDLYSATLDISDLSKPKVDYVRWDGDNLLYVFFNEDIDEETGLNVNNYFLYDGGEFIKLTGATSFFEGNKIVKINVKDQKSKINTTRTKLFITGVKDVAGNEIEAGVTEDPIDTIANNKTKMTSATATATNVIEVLFSSRLSLVDKDAFKIEGLGSDVAIDMDEQLDGGNTKLILTLNKEMGYDAAGIKVKIDADGAKLLKDLFDEEVATGTVVVTDKIAPVLDGDPVKVDNRPEIVLTFKENVIKVDGASDSAAATDFVITDKDDKTLRADIDYLVTVASSSDDPGSKDITITLKNSYANYVGKLNIKTASTMQYITDKSDNYLAEFSKDITLKGKSIYGFRYTLPENIVADNEIVVPVTFKATTVNDDGYDHVILKFEVTKKPDDAAEVTFKATDTAGTPHTFINSGVWGPASGFPIPKDYDETTDWKITFDTEGEYTIEFKAVELDDLGQEVKDIVTDSVTVEVDNSP